MKATSPRHLLWMALIVVGFVFLSQSVARAVPIIGLTNSNKLVLFDSTAPGAIISTTTISGLQPGEDILGIDFRPATGQLYALGSTSRLYVINPSTGAARLVRSAPFSPMLSGTAFGFDFNPVADHIRVTSINGQNLRLDPNTGEATTDTPLAYAPSDPRAIEGAGIAGVAYDNNFAGAPSTTLYGIDWRLGALVTQGTSEGAPVSPNSGQLFTVGSLSTIQITENLGFDIAPGGTAFAALQGTDAVASRLFTITLSTGRASVIGFIGGGDFIRGISVVPVSATVFAVNQGNELLRFNSATPDVITSRTPITGLQLNEVILSIDFRPATGQLYGLGSTSRLYRIDTSTAVATQVGTGTFSPTPLPGGAGNNFSVGFDFNPVTDEIRLVLTNQNLRLNPDTGAVVTTDAPLAYAAGDTNAGRTPSVFAAAHTNSFPGATSTTLYDIDDDPSMSIRPFLARQGSVGSSPASQNSGQLSTVGQIIDAGFPVDFVGFDIAPGANGQAFATFISSENNGSKFYSIDLSTARASAAGFVGAPGQNQLGTERVRDIAVATVGTFQFNAESYSVVEDCTTVQITVTRSGDTSNETTVEFATSDIAGVNPASSRSDYNAVFGTLRFAAGETSNTFVVLINEDSINEKLAGQQAEGFQVTLSNPSAGFTLDARRTAAVSIIDDATEPATNAINDTGIFVCQQYHDFLNRQPDTEGFNFWVNNIESCGNDAGCREVKRIDTSAAFFLSPEFQDTGFVVYRTYQAAFGQRVQGVVPLKLEEFLPDVQRIGQGVIGNQPGATQLLEANTRAFFNEFLIRPAFIAQYPVALTPAQYVDALNANAGGSLSQPERDALVAGLNNGTETRATVLRKVVLDRDFRQAGFNRAFVLMQYFGYLRRNPNDAPDTDFSGFNFWLNKLNEFSGDFRRAEMVKSFIISGEYRRRFGLQ